MVADPLEGMSIAEFGRSLRRGETSIESTVEAYLERIRLLDGRLGAYEYVAGDLAVATARAMDRMLAAGVDLGTADGCAGRGKRPHRR